MVNILMGMNGYPLLSFDDLIIKCSDCTTRIKDFGLCKDCQNHKKIKKRWRLSLSKLISKETLLKTKLPEDIIKFEILGYL